LRRREALTGLAAGLAGLLTSPAGFAQRAGSCVLTPDSGEGPFYFDPRLVRTDITENRPGAPLDLRVQIVRERDCATLTDARVDVWHADAAGLYSGYARQSGNGSTAAGSAVGQTFLRGTQLTDAEGNVSFTTIFPSWYRGRTPHIHFKVFLAQDEVVASQIFFPEDVNDEVFGRWEPYREHATRRDTRNAEDTFLDGRTGGVFCDIEARPGGGQSSYRATLVVAVRNA
jgi:protocatechuate 3,4-dioxygenase beta subunit